jgi:hypothetical protein
MIHKHEQHVQQQLIPSNHPELIDLHGEYPCISLSFAIMEPKFMRMLALRNQPPPVHILRLKSIIYSNFSWFEDILMPYLSKNPMLLRKFKEFYRGVGSPTESLEIRELANAFLFICDMLQRSNINNNKVICLIQGYRVPFEPANLHGDDLQAALDGFGLFYKYAILQNPYLDRTVILGQHILRLPHGFNDTSGYETVHVPYHLTRVLRADRLGRERLGFSMAMRELFLIKAQLDSRIK